MTAAQRAASVAAGQIWRHRKTGRLLTVTNVDCRYVIGFTHRATGRYVTRLDRLTLARNYRREGEQ